MGDTHRAVGGVHVLPARSGRAIRVDPEVLILDLDIDVIVDLRIDPHAGEAGVPSSVGVIRTDAHETMDSAFDLEVAVGILALDEHGGRLDPGLLTRMVVNQLSLEAV